MILIILYLRYIIGHLLLVMIGRDTISNRLSGPSLKKGLDKKAANELLAALLLISF